MSTPVGLTVTEAHSLADRLQSRGTSKLFTGQPEVAADMRLACRLIRTLLRSFNPRELIIVADDDPAE